jgi:putative FmdB family regulatory protein
MPYYECECTRCGEKFNEKRRFEEHDRGKRVKCPKRRTQKVKPVIGSVQK